MPELTTDYTVFYRWQWFIRERWQEGFREQKKHSTHAFAECVKERGALDRPVLDCSCGFGLKTIVMREAGLLVEGSDICAEAIASAANLAAEEGLPDLRYFTSSWADLPAAAGKQYAAIFTDALSWIPSEEEMTASLKGLHDALDPGGFIAHMGALPGTDTDQAEILERDWRNLTGASGKYALGWEHERDGVHVTETIVHERARDHIDSHFLYLINEHGETRLEAMTMRRSFLWSWPKMERFLSEAGFGAFEVKEFAAANGKHSHLILSFRQ